MSPDRSEVGAEEYAEVVWPKHTRRPGVVSAGPRGRRELR